MQSEKINLIRSSGRCSYDGSYHSAHPTTQSALFRPSSMLVGSTQMIYSCNLSEPTRIRPHLLVVNIGLTLGDPWPGQQPSHRWLLVQYGALRKIKYMIVGPWSPWHARRNSIVAIYPAWLDRSWTLFWSTSKLASLSGASDFELAGFDVEVMGSWLPGIF